MERKLGIISDCICGANPLDTLDLLKEAGFSNFFTGLFHYDDVKALKDKALRLGLEFEFIHAPFHGINKMWLEGDEYKELYAEILESIDSASTCGVKTIICHISSGWFPPEICDLGLARFDEIVDYAEKKKVIVAFENLRMIGNVSYFVDRYASKEYVKFCYDCGHEHCYTESNIFVDIFGDRLICTHIHDNYGRSKEDPLADMDYHMLPFDGNINYQDVIDKLDENNYQGSIMLELNNDRYQEMSPKEFVFEAYKRASKINELSRK